jgi:hypothetical protein
MSYQRPTITVVGSVRGLTLETPIQSCKYGYGADSTMPNEPGLADLNGEWKDDAPASCFS